MFRQEQVEATVWEYVERHLLDPDKLEEGVRNVQNSRAEESQRLQAQKANLEQKLNTLKLQREKLISLYMNGMFTMEEIGIQKQHLETQQQSYEEGLKETELLLAKEETTDHDIQQLREFATLIRQKLDITTFEHRKHILYILGIQAQMNIEEDGTRYLNVTSHLSPAAAEKLLLISPNQAPS